MAAFNGSITISVQQIDPAPVFGTPNRFDSDEGSSSVFDLSGDLQHTESLAYQSGYSAPSWLTISGLTLVITNAQQVSQDTDFDVLLAAESTKIKRQRTDRNDTGSMSQFHRRHPLSQRCPFKFAGDG